MRRFILSLFALCFLFISPSFGDERKVEPPHLQVAGGFGVGNNLTGFWQKKSSAVAVTPTLVFTDSENNNGNGTSYTYSDQGTGVADPTRVTIVGVCGEDGTPDFSVSSMTIGGVTANKQAGTAVATENEQCAAFTLANPTGTIATVVVTFSEAITAANIHTYAAYNLNSATATDFAESSSAGGAANDLSVDVMANGIVVAVEGIEANAEDVTWTGVTQDNALSGTEHTTESASTVVVGAQTPLSITADYTGTSTQAGVAIALR